MKAEEETIEGFRLSPQQKRLWILQQNTQREPYRAQCAIQIDGKLNPERLQQAIEQVVSRHEILRTRFSQISGVTLPLQIVEPPAKIIISPYDFSGISAKDQMSHIDSLFFEARQHSLALHTSLPLKISHIGLAPQRHVLLVTLPALCSDSISLENFFSELIFSLRSNEHAEGMATEPLQYADLSQWQLEMQESPEAETGKTYWQNQKYPSLARYKLPFESIQTQSPNFSPTSFPIPIEQETVKDMERFVSTQQTSPSTFLFACWFILLWRITGESKLVVGNYFHGRSHAELKNALGLFGKYLPVQLILDNDTRFTDFLDRSEQAMHEGEQWHEYFDWDLLLRPDSNERSLGFSPFTFHYEEHVAPIIVGSHTFSLFKQYTCIDRFHLKLSCVHEDNSLSVDLYYDSQSIIKTDIPRLAQQFHTVLKSVLRNPETLVSEIQVMGDAEREQILIEFNRTEKDIPSHQSIHQLFEAQVTETPDRIAIACEDRNVTYGELNMRANQVAHYLQRHGVGHDVVVGLCLNRSLEMIIGLLGILKAGGAYLPLDATLPIERIEYMLQVANAPFILTQEDWREKLANIALPLLSLDSAWEIEAKESQENPKGQGCSRNLVYILFTSGSTGKPKGVAVEHRQLLHYVDGVLDRLTLPPGSSFATLSPLTADLGNTMLYPCLSTGGTLHILSEEQANDAPALARYFQRHHPDCLKIVPSHLEALLTNQKSGVILPRLRLVLGGESCHWSLVKRVQTLMPESLVMNHYGPTETTVGVTTHRLEVCDQDQNFSSVVPIGRPLPNTQIYLLDKHLRPVPIGVVGQLYVSGHGVTRGYATRSSLTAERYLPNPFTSNPGTRMYRTGDLARFHPDGPLDFLGRADHQVKIRGYRIELGEIEMVLRGHPAVQEAAVILHNDSFHDPQLVAYIVANQHFSLSHTELQFFLTHALPNYMVPTTIVFLNVLPRTSNGKVDRQALPSPNLSTVNLVHAIVAPRNIIEEQLMTIWQEVLHVDQVSIYHNFLELGGNSLLAIKLIAAIKARLNLDLLFRDLFDHPTVAGLAETLMNRHVIPTQDIDIQQVSTSVQDREEGWL